MPRITKCEFKILSTSVRKFTTYIRVPAYVDVSVSGKGASGATCWWMGSL